MGKIFCLMGKSSTGKDTVYKRLMKKDDLALKTIVPYTTRPIRAGEQDGVEYFFTDEAGFQKLREDGKIIEDRAYDTFYGLWRYFTVDDGRICPEKEDYLVIGTLEAYLKILNYYGKDKVVPIMITLDDGVRLQRAIDREKKQEHPKYEELCRRFLADSADFSEEKLKEAQIKKQFYNDDLDTCVEEIAAYIKGNK